jgi:capsular polysaccharide biosynthesis protein
MTASAWPVLRPRGIFEMMADGDGTPDARICHAHSMAPAEVSLKPLHIGAGFFERWRVSERPPSLGWRDDHYVCTAPALMVVRDAILHSSAGILCIDGELARETLFHTVPATHRYAEMADGIAVELSDVRHLPGTHVSILAGAKRNYFHALMDGVMRLAIPPPPYLAQAESMLCPEGAVAQAAALALLDLPAPARITRVADGQSVRVDRLLLPWTVHGEFQYHPCVREWFARMSAAVPERGKDFPRRIYIDRRGAAFRPLQDEAAVLEAVRRFGFVAVRPETLSLADQIRLFRGAEAIVAPHGAGLTNLGFCRPGCVVLELHMDAYVHWCYRHLSALCGLRYDCVLGRAVMLWPDDVRDVGGMPWSISPDHVSGAIAHMLQAQ